MFQLIILNSVNYGGLRDDSDGSVPEMPFTVNCDDVCLDFPPGA